jgi:hypothetical protein
MTSGFEQNELLLVQKHWKNGKKRQKLIPTNNRHDLEKKKSHQVGYNDRATSNHFSQHQLDAQAVIPLKTITHKLSLHNAVYALARFAVLPPPSDPSDVFRFRSVASSLPKFGPLGTTGVWKVSGLGSMLFSLPKPHSG